MVQDLTYNLCKSLEVNLGNVADVGGEQPQPTPQVVATPVITLTGLYTATITCTTDGATIYYTLNGDTPTTSSTQYTSAISLTDNCTINAIAVKSGMTDSNVASYNFTSPILTEWRVVGNSQVQGNEIWSCGEYSAVDSKYHIKVNNGVSIADIALDEPLRKVNDVADKIEFANGVATVTRKFGSEVADNMNWEVSPTTISDKYRFTSSVLKNVINKPLSNNDITNILNSLYETKRLRDPYNGITGIGVSTGGIASIYDENYNTMSSLNDFLAHISGTEIIYELATPTTETIQVPDIEVSPTDTYTCVINQGAKAVSWSSFETELN